MSSIPQCHVKQSISTEARGLALRFVDAGDGLEARHSGTQVVLGLPVHTSASTAFQPDHLSNAQGLYKASCLLLLKKQQHCAQLFSSALTRCSEWHLKSIVKEGLVVSCRAWNARAPPFQHTAFPRSSIGTIATHRWPTSKHRWVMARTTHPSLRARQSCWAAHLTFST